jgi:hypothetical protein
LGKEVVVEKRRKKGSTVYMSGRSGGSNYGADDDGGVLGNVQEMVMGAVALMVLYCGWRFINSPTANLLGKTVNGAANTLQWSLSSPFALILSLILVAAGYVALQIGRFQMKRWTTKIESKDATEAEVDRETQLANAENARKPQGEGTGRVQYEDQAPRNPEPANWTDPMSKIAGESSNELRKDKGIMELLHAKNEISYEFLQTYIDAINEGSERLTTHASSYQPSETSMSNNPSKYSGLSKTLKILSPTQKESLQRLTKIMMTANMGAMKTVIDANVSRSSPINTVEELFKVLPREQRKVQMRWLLTGARLGMGLPEGFEQLKVNGGKTLKDSKRSLDIGKIQSMIKDMDKDARNVANEDTARTDLKPKNANADGQRAGRGGEDRTKGEDRVFRK